MLQTGSQKMDLKIIFIVGKGSNREKCWKTKSFVEAEGCFQKNSRKFNCSGQTRTH